MKRCPLCVICHARPGLELFKHRHHKRISNKKRSSATSASNLHGTPAKDLCRCRQSSVGILKVAAIKSNKPRQFFPLIRTFPDTNRMQRIRTDLLSLAPASIIQRGSRSARSHEYKNCAVVRENMRACCHLKMHSRPNNFARGRNFKGTTNPLQHSAELSRSLRHTHAENQMGKQSEEIDG